MPTYLSILIFKNSNFLSWICNIHVEYLKKYYKLCEARSQPSPPPYTIYVVWSNKVFLPGRSGLWLRPAVSPSSSPKCRLCFWHPIPRRLNAKIKNNNLMARFPITHALLSTNGHWLSTLGQALSSLGNKNHFSRSILSPKHILTSTAYTDISKMYQLQLICP